jgi:hypothetical protein
VRWCDEHNIATGCGMDCVLNGGLIGWNVDGGRVSARADERYEQDATRNNFKKSFLDHWSKHSH